MNPIQQKTIEQRLHFSPVFKRQQTHQLRGRSTLKIVLPHFQGFSKRDFSLNMGCSRMDSLLEKEQSQIQVSQLFAWILLLTNTLFTAIVPCWIMSNLEYESLTRNSWRFLALSILILPFVAYQKRRIAQTGGNIWDLLTADNLRLNFICGINYCIWLLIIIYAAKFTSVTHAFSLVALKHFVTTLIKLHKRQESHDFQTAGIILISVGILCMLYDSATGEVLYGRSNEHYLSYSNASRVFGDLLAFCGSIIDVLLGEQYQVPSAPRFLNLMLYNICISFNLISLGYFFGGSEMSFNEYYGVFGLFSGENFVGIFYVAIMLGVNLMLSNILLNQIFSGFIIKIASSFNILGIALFFNMFNVELTHSGYTAFSYGFIVPGLILILSGQNTLANADIKIDYVIYRPQEQPKRQSVSLELLELQPIQEGMKASVRSKSCFGEHDQNSKLPTIVQ